ncbi:hypothetical protein LXA43DRAFT_898667 [Ganoderma leucocontextum]|nr:hypothetical protein LXA43DRAFT_898667 [Ganoderma leucocontextum]
MSRWRQFSMDSWMDKFCPGDRTTQEALTPLPQDIKDNLKAITDKVFAKYLEGKSFTTLGKEAKMYAPINALIQGILDEYGLKDLEALDTANHKTDDGGYDKHATIPDCGIYRVNDQARRATVLLPKHLRKSNMDPELKAERAPHLARRSWHWIDVLMEAKWSPELSAFYTDDQHGTDFIRDSIKGREALGQVAEYMTHIFRCQHRTFAFAIYFVQDKARFLYFDRTGAAVSHWCSFEKDLYLQEFVYRLAKASLADRGHDPTATLVPFDSQDAQNFRSSADGLVESSLLRKWVVDSTKSSCPIYKLKATSVTRDAESGASISRDFLVGRPYFSSDTLVGRCTRAYIAFDPVEKSHCFLKDYWRPVVLDRTHPEHEVYERLYARLEANGKTTKNLPTLICAGDLDGHNAQKSRVDAEIRTDQNASAPPVPRTHYRLVLREVGVPLEKFPNFKTLLNLILQAVDTHANAWEYAGVLHRDISVGNILVKFDWEKNKVVGSMLCDWDLSKYGEDLGTEPTQPDRTGTWQFKSAMSLLFPWKAYELADDVESFIHVLNYLVLKYHPTNLGSELEGHIVAFFGFHEVHDHTHYGGKTKWRLLEDADKAPYKVVGTGKDPLQALIDSLASLCHNQYLLKRPFIDNYLSEFRHPFPFPLSQHAQKPPTKPAVADEPLDPFHFEWVDDPASLSEAKTDSSNLPTTFPEAFSLAPPPEIEPETTLQDHRGLLAALRAANRSGNWDMGDKGEDQFARFQSTACRSGKLSFKSSFSTSEQFFATSPGPPSAAKRRLPRRKPTKRRKGLTGDLDEDAAAGVSEDTNEDEDEAENPGQEENVEEGEGETGKGRGD